MTRSSPRGTGLIARYGMNEGTGTAVANSIAGGPAGVAVNGPLWVPGAPFGGGGGNRAAGRADRPERHPGQQQRLPQLEREHASPTWPATTSTETAHRAGPTVQAVGAGDIASCSSTGDEATAALLATISGDVLALGDTVYESGTPTEYTNCYDPSWGQPQGAHAPGRGQPRVRHGQCVRLLRLLRRRRRHARARATTATTTATWHIIVLNSMCANVGGCGAGSAQLQLAAGRPRRQRRAVHDGPLAPPALQLGRQPRQRPDHPAALPGALRRQRRPDPDRPRPHIRALRAADRDRRARHEPRHPPVRRRHRRPQPLRPGHTCGPTARSTTATPTASSSSSSSRPATTGSSCPRPAGPSPTRGIRRVPRRERPARRIERAAERRDATDEHLVSSTRPPSTARPTTTSSPPSTTPARSRRPRHRDSPRRPRRPDRALDFDGINDHVTFGSAPPSLNSNTFTIETWFRRDGTGVAATTSAAPAA